MRRNLVHEGAGELSYEIREIAKLAHKIKAEGQEISWENIGDPIAKGASVPEWVKEIIGKAVQKDENYGYSPTRGLDSARAFIAKNRGISVGDLLFFNGLGDAVSKVYNYLERNARVIGPSPAYPTHSSAEAAHAGATHLTYQLNPDRNWLPDMEDLRNKVKYNPSIAGILIINPDNPTGMVYPKVILKQMVELAREYDLFLISDEIYGNIHYGEEGFCALSDVIDDVPGIAMRGLSKEIPWPGARCGWIEMYNQHKDENFSQYLQSLEAAKMLEVCSTTLPQAVLPEILGDVRYEKHLEDKAAFYKRRAEQAHKILSKVPGVRVVKPQGTFYISVVFQDGVLPEDGRLEIENARIQEIVEEAAARKTAGQRFVYFLLGAAGICVVPLNGFNSDLPGFRATLLEEDDEKFEYIFETIAEKIKEYTKK